MCGIAGILNSEGRQDDDEGIMRGMLSMLRHRGPDESGMYLDPLITLGQSRLSIIDLQEGTQPISNEDQTMWIVYNGEIFNYIELRSELEAEGHSFATGTDTEVILHLYEQLGARSLERLNGQFAFAIWDASRQELFLARDRVGVRPLFYIQEGNRFLFSSEIKALFLVPGIRREIDINSVAQVFTFWTTLTPHTAFTNVFEVPPGHYMTISGGRCTKSSYWSIPSSSVVDAWQGSYDEASEELQTILKDAVRLRLRADVPVGAYLSGGLDSSILTSLVSRHFNNRLRTFSLGFQSGPFDESSFQKELVDYLGSEHSRIEINNSDIIENLPGTIWHCEKPLLRTSPVPMMLLSRLVRDSGFKVVLTGEGADEIFAGYNIFKEAKVRDYIARQPNSAARPRLLEKLYPYIFTQAARSRFYLQKFFTTDTDAALDPLFSHRIRWMNGKRNLTFLSDAAWDALGKYDPVSDVCRNLPPDFAERPLLAKAQFLEMDIFFSNYLLSSQGDRVAMANSVELRHPFLDPRVIDFAFRLPHHWKLRGLQEKYILRKSYSNALPQGIANRIKHPFRAPIREAFSTKRTSNFFQEYLSEESLRKSGYFNTDKVKHLLAKFASDTVISNEFQNMAITGILSTQILYRQFIQEFPSAGDCSPAQMKIFRNFGTGVRQ